jgi:diguanylate cyclase (GGDEF)-like protein
MKSSDLRALRAPAARRLIGTFVAAALAPLVVAAAALLARGALGAAGALTLLGVAAAGAMLALVLGARHALGTLHRTEELVAGMRNIVLEKFPVNLDPAKSEEFARVARTFNDMARDLASKRAVQGLLAQMDEAMLTQLDMRELVRTALRAASHAARAEAAVLALFGDDDDKPLQVFIMRRSDTSKVERVRLEPGTEFRRDQPISARLETSGEAPLPAALTARLLKEDGIQQFFTQPVRRAGQTWGALISCHKAPARMSTPQVQLLSAVSNRLIAGLRSFEHEKKLHSLAFVDRLTRLPNRAAFGSLLADRLAVARRDKLAIGVLFVDLDHFKHLNDSFGQELGDRVLKEASRRMREQLIEDDVAARVGGDKFTLILSHVGTRRDVARVARSIIAALSQPFDIDGRMIYSGASIGIALYPECGDGENELWKMAETAMYQAKSEGRNRLAFFEKRMQAQSQRHSRLDTELREALTRGELVIHYQPQIDLTSGTLYGVEALVRWQHPSLGLLSPGDFIADAEQMGLIPQIGAWVLREACLQHRRWRAAGVDVPRIAVNASSGQLPRSNFVATVRQIMAITELPPNTLELEVTESLLVEGGNAAVDALNQLAADGVQIAIDDFGTGYSSFNYLRTMPAHVLKLDMSFIVDVKADNDACKIVSAMIDMAHALQKSVVAEGIERTDQLLLLKSLGCDRGQGYLLGKPVNAAEIARIYAGTWHGERPLPLLEDAPMPPAPMSAPTPARRGQQAASGDTSGGRDWNEDDLDEQLTVPRFLADDEA